MTTEKRAAYLLLLSHAFMLTLSGIAFATFLAPPSPAWLLTPSNQKFAALMFTYGGQTTVVLGALAAIVHAAYKLGTRTAVTIFVAAFSISLTAELMGTITGFPFGPYAYTTQLGYLIYGRVPFNIPTSWFYMLYASLALCGRFLRADDSRGSRWKWAFIAALVLTAWDVSMDPAMVSTTHWLWHLKDANSLTPVDRFFLTDIFYGMPLTNWLGWLITGFIIARVLLAVVPPSGWAMKVSGALLPRVLYAVNGLFPILICAGRHLWWAVILGTLAMLIPLALGARVPERAPARRGEASRPRSALPA